MNSLEVVRAVSDQRLNEAGFHEKSLAQHELPQAHLFTAPDEAVLEVVTFGSPDAPYKLVEPTPYLTGVDEDHYKLRLKAHAVALGPDYEVIGVGQYDPSKADLNFSARRKVARGDFSPFSERIAFLGEKLHLGEAVGGVMLRGYSFGADAATQTAHDVEFDENKGVFALLGLSAEELARAEDRGARKVTGAMNASGKRLTDNILASDVPALNEAWGIPADADEKAAKKAVNRRVNTGAVEYFLGDLRSNLALVRGFGTDASIDQLEKLQRDANGLGLFVHRQSESSVFTEAAFARLTGERADEALEVPNDHSRDDDIRASAASVLYFAELVVRPAAA